MKEEDFDKEKQRRNVEDEIFKCVCGIVFIGKNRDFDKHLNHDCPVFQEASTKLSK